jgi:hypothetical protein
VTDRVDGVKPVEGRDRRAVDRRAAERRAASMSRALVPLDPQPEAAEPSARPAPTPPADPGASAFSAQLMGQTGQRRGLKGGPPVLDAARASYLGAEYSGAAERRPKPGKAEDSDI